MSNATISRSQSIFALKWLAALGVPMLVFFLTPFDVMLRAYLAISLGAILFWALQVIPEAITGLLIPILFCIVGIVDETTAFTSWSMILPWLVLAGIIMGNVMTTTGLVKRIAYKILLLTGCSSTGLLIACIMIGVFVPLLVSSTWAKLLILGPIGMAICKTWNLAPKSKAATGIMAMIMFASLSSCHLYMSGDDAMIFIVSLFREVSDGAINIDFFQWLKYMWLPGLGWLLMSIFTPYLMFVRPNRKLMPDISESVRKEYQAMGKMSKEEIKARVIVLLILANFMLETKTGLNAAHVMVVLVSLFFVPGINLVSGKDLAKMDIWIIFFVTGALTVGICSTPVGFTGIVEDQLLPILTSVGDHTRVLLSYAFGVIVNFFMTPLGAQGAFELMIGKMCYGVGLDPVSTMMGFQM
ncbi:MAG: SLC13 family permease, partial [Peptococcaceae bacterium]|nr:SLC13 family permease [Peptococcaceae bacterium]